MSSEKEDMKSDVTLVFKVSATNPFDLRKKKDILHKFSRLPMDDQQRIEKIIQNPKALAGLKEHEQLLEQMFK